MGVDVLPRLQQIGNLPSMRDAARGEGVGVLGDAVEASPLGARVVAIGEGSGGVVARDVLAEAGEVALHGLEQPLRLELLEVLIVLATLSHGRRRPASHVLIVHIRQHHARPRIALALFVAEVHVEIAFGPRLVVVFLAMPGRGAAVAEEIVVHVGHPFGLELEVEREYSRGLR